MSRLSIATRMMFVFAVIAVTQVAIAAVGLHGFKLSDDDIAEVYQERLVPVSQLSRINDLMHVSVEQLTIAVIARPSPKNVQPYIDRVERNLSDINGLVGQYSRHVIGDDDRKLLGDWTSKRDILVGKGIKPAIAALQKQAFDDAEDTVLGVAVKQFEATQHAFDAIVANELKRAEHTHDQANERYNFTKYLTIGAVTLALGLCGLMAFYVKRSITRPLVVMSAAMKALADGDKTVEIPYVERSDEVGETAKAAQTFKDSLLRIEAMETEQKEAEARAVSQRKADMSRLANEFEAAIGHVVASVSSASTELEATASTLTRTAGTTQQLSCAVASASEQASVNVQSVASSAEELAASVGEIGRQVHEFEPHRGGCGQAGGADRRSHRRAVEGGGANRRRGKTDHRNRRADQSARAQRHDRGGARRRRRQGIRHRRSGGQVARQRDRQGDQGDRHPYRRHADGDRRFGQSDQGDRRHDWPHRGDRVGHRRRGRAAGRRNPGNLP